MTETNSKIVVAIADQAAGNNVQYSLEQLKEMSKKQFTLYVDNQSLILDSDGKIQENVLDPIYPFMGMVNCPKCNEQNPYRKGMTTYDKEFNLLNRRCSSCSFEWLERCGDYKEESSDGSDQTSEAG